MSKDFSVVLRCAGERTELLSKTCLERQTGLPVTMVRERPFWRALKKSMEIGLQTAAQWTVVMDADVLLARGALNAIGEELERAAASDFYMLDLLLLDKSFGGPAHAGGHIYNTRLFERATPFIEAAAGEIRPETYICQQMQALGFPFISSFLVTGLHDYLQYYRDLYRKNYVRSYKYRELWQYMLNRCRLQYGEDDFKVILWGYLDGLQDTYDGAPPVLDSEAYLDKSQGVIEMLRLEEKSPLAVTEELLDLPAAVLRDFSADHLYRAKLAMPPYRVFGQEARAGALA